MKKKTIIGILLLTLLLISITGIHKQIAINVNEEYNIYIDKLQKYEMVFVYPKGQEQEIEKIKNELKQIYNLAHDKLIVNYVEYDKEDCKNSIIADINLKGDVSYRSILFVYTNSDMCEHIQYAMQNTTSSVSKHKEGFARQKIITIPIDKEAKSSMEKWSKQRTDWLNFKNTTTTTSAIEEMYNVLDITKEEVKEANENANNGDIQVEEIELPKIDENVNNDTVMEYENEDIKIKHQIQNVKVVLSNGMIVTPEKLDVSKEIQTIGLNTSTVHGAKVYIQYLISIEKVNEEENVEYKNVKIQCKNDKLTFEENIQMLDKKITNKEEGWTKDNETFVNTMSVGESKRIIGYQTITNGMDLTYENKIIEVSYEKTTTITIDGVGNENTEYKKITDIIKSNVVKIEEE